MAYTALPDHRIPYDNDGTLVYVGTLATGAATAQSGAALIEWQDYDFTDAGTQLARAGQYVVWMFFTAQHEVTAFFIRRAPITDAAGTWAVHGSNDTGNGLDGTWETASLPGGQPTYVNDFSWRDGIKAISFTGPKKNIRFVHTNSYGGGGSAGAAILHVYGEPAAGQMAHDLVYIDHDTTPGTAFTAPEDFGDQPLGTTVVRQFRIKNTSASRTATGINIQCNDADFVIAESAAGPWVVTINLASLLPGAESPTYYVRCTTPAVGNALMPRFARIVTVCDAGFFG